MSVRSGVERIVGFDEISDGYTPNEAMLEAHRCLNCKNAPCTEGCPVAIRIPDFIARVKEGDFEGAYQIISTASSLPAVCGRVCPQETQCEARCVRGIKGEPVAIGALERFVADWHNSHAAEMQDTPTPCGIKVAVVGSGPSGLTCAGDLARMGYSVEVFEALHELGGVLTYGIPEFRLPKSIVKKEIDELRRLGVKLAKNAVIGKSLTVDELLEEFSAVYIATGAGLPKFMGIPGENSKGVYSANEYLTRVNLCGAYKPTADTPIMKGGAVAVVGGGNVAVDAARTALRLGAKKVYLVYRRSRDELPARQEEIEHAIEEGVELMLLCSPTKILTYGGDCEDVAKRGFVRAMELVRMELGTPDERGRRRPIPVNGSDFTLNIDTVVMAIGTTPNPLIKDTTAGLDTDRVGCIVADEHGRTSKHGVFAGGDAVTGAATVISAMGAGKTAAKAIDAFLKEDKDT